MEAGDPAQLGQVEWSLPRDGRRVDQIGLEPLNLLELLCNPVNLPGTPHDGILQPEKGQGV